MNKITKKIIGLFSFLFLTILVGNSFAIELEFDDDMLDCFPCASYAHYDVWFNTTGNDFDGVVIWSGIQELTTPVLLEFPDKPGAQCPLQYCDNDKILCSKQVVGLYYDKARGERMRPMDPTSHGLLTGGTCGGVGYDGLVMTGGWYTDCTGADVKPTKYPVNPYGVYGEIRQTRSGETYHLYAGLGYDIMTNQLQSGNSFFVNNIQFVPNLNPDPDSKLDYIDPYRYYTGGLQGILFDNYGGIGFVGNRSCIVPGDLTVMEQGDILTGYRHNDKVGQTPVMDYELLQCVNGTIIGRPGYDYVTPLDCVTTDGITIPHNSGHWMRKDNVFPYSSGDYVDNVSGYVNLSGWDDASFKTCWDGYITGDIAHTYANPIITSPKNCSFPGNNKFIKHLDTYTGYQYLSTDFVTASNCEVSANFQCFDGIIQTGTNNQNASVPSDATQFQYNQCTVLESKQCVSPWGTPINDGQSVVAYQNSKEITGLSSCTAQTRVCSDGSLSGSYLYQSCTLIHQDKTPDVISFDPQSNLPLSVMVLSNSQVIDGLDNQIEVDIKFESAVTGSLIVNGVDIGTEGTVSNGDIITVKLKTSSLYNTTTTASIDLNGVRSFFAITTKQNTDKVFADKYPKPTEFTTSMKRAVFTKYSKLLQKYEAKASNMCKVTDGLTSIIGNMLFKVNKNLIVTSSNEIRKEEFFKKQVLEYLLEITKNYKNNLVRKVLVNSAGEGEYMEVVGCYNE